MLRKLVYKLARSCFWDHAWEPIPGKHWSQIRCRKCGAEATDNPYMYS